MDKVGLNEKEWEALMALLNTPASAPNSLKKAMTEYKTMQGADVALNEEELLNLTKAPTEPSESLEALHIKYKDSF